jgi:hypothetical protein
MTVLSLPCMPRTCGVPNSHACAQVLRYTDFERAAAMLDSECQKRNITLRKANNASVEIKRATDVKVELHDKSVLSTKFLVTITESVRQLRCRAIL